MAKAYNATCLVIKHTKLGETDTIVTMLSDEGEQIRAVAKGLRKPGNRIGARLQLYSEVSLLLHSGRSLDIVREVTSIQTHASLREELELTASASVIAEFLEKLGRDGMVLEGRMYEMARAAFALMEDLDAEHSSLIACAFLMKAMTMQGFGPAVFECALCGNPTPEVAVFDRSSGGSLCPNCAERLKISGSVDLTIATWVGSLIHCTFAELSEAESAPVIALLDLTRSWLHEHLAIDLKSISFLKTFLAF